MAVRYVYKCPVCDEEFETKDEALEHLDEEHLELDEIEESDSCEFCRHFDKGSPQKRHFPCPRSIFDSDLTICDLYRPAEA